MPTSTPVRVEIHPPIEDIFNDPWYDEDDYDDDECTEGMDLIDCDELCTKANKRAGLCKCKRKKDR